MQERPSPQEEPHEVTDHADDAVIGKALRGSGIVLLLIAVVVVLVLFVRNRPSQEEAGPVTDLVAPETPALPPAQIPTVDFRDITREAGIQFVHNNGAAGDKLLPETMGGGVAFFDFDRDGDQDLLFVNGTAWPDADPAEASTPALYANDGTGQFSDVTAGSGLDISVYGMGVACGDYDSDGLPDVYLTNVGRNLLLRNLGHGKFEDVTEATGVGGADDDWSTCASWFDYDNDGDLDLFVGNYVKWNKEIDFQLGSTLVGFGRAYGQPMNFEGSFPKLFKNNSDGQFVDATTESGFQVANPATGVPVAKSLGVAPLDLNRDGWMDLVVANDTVPNFVFSNRWDRTFKEVGALTGIAYDAYGKARGAMGIDSACFREDEALAVGIGNFANEMTALYVEQSRAMIFTDEAIPAGIGPASRLLLKFGLFFFDYDLDGWQDLLTANGHLEEEISQIQKSQHYEQPAQLFWNSGPEYGCQYLEVGSDLAGEDLFAPIVGRGSAFADIDSDGDLDVVMTQVGGAPRLLRNDGELGRHWIRLRLVGKTHNRDGIGAWIKVSVGGRELRRQVMPTRSYLSQSELPVTFGLGEATTIDAVEITWPGGNVQSVPVDTIALEQTTTITEE